MTEVSYGRKTRKNEARDAAAERAANWAKLSAKEKLAALDKRLGKGIGAKRQRARLEAELTATKQKKTA